MAAIYVVFALYVLLTLITAPIISKISKDHKFLKEKLGIVIETPEDSKKALNTIFWKIHRGLLFWVIVICSIITFMNLYILV